MRSPQLLLAGLTLILLGACGDSEREPIAPTPSSTSHEGGASGDGASEGSASDGAGGKGAGEGDGGDGDGPPTWCTAQGAHDLCDDFDAPAHDPWVEAESGAPGRPAGATVTSETASSPPSALATSIGGADVGTESARIRSMVEAEGTTSAAITFSFDVYPVTLGASPRLEIASVRGFNIVDLRDYGVALVVAGTPPRLALEIDEADDGVSTQPLGAQLPAAQWTRVTLDLVLTLGTGVDGEPSSITVRIGDEEPESFSMRRHMPLNPFFTIGVRAAAPCEPSTVLYDDVTYDSR